MWKIPKGLQQKAPQPPQIRPDDLVGGWTNPFEKYNMIVKLGIICLRIGLNIKNIWTPLIFPKVPLIFPAGILRVPQLPPPFEGGMIYRILYVTVTRNNVWLIRCRQKHVRQGSAGQLCPAAAKEAKGSDGDRWMGFRYHIYIYLRSTPHPVTVTTRIITFLVGNPYKPSFATVTGWGVDLIYTIHSNTPRVGINPETTFQEGKSWRRGGSGGSKGENREANGSRPLALRVSLVLEKLIPKDLGPSNGRVWTWIAGVRSSK